MSLFLENQCCKRICIHLGGKYAVGPPQAIERTRTRIRLALLFYGWRAGREREEGAQPRRETEEERFGGVGKLEEERFPIWGGVSKLCGWGPEKQGGQIIVGKRNRTSFGLLYVMI